MIFDGSACGNSQAGGKRLLRPARIGPALEGGHDGKDDSLHGLYMAWSLGDRFERAADPRGRASPGHRGAAERLRRAGGPQRRHRRSTAAAVPDVRAPHRAREDARLPRGGLRGASLMRAGVAWALLVGARRSGRFEKACLESVDQLVGDGRRGRRCDRPWSSSESAALALATAMVLRGRSHGGGAESKSGDHGPCARGRWARQTASFTGGQTTGAGGASAWSHGRRRGRPWRSRPTRRRHPQSHRRT